MPFESFPPPYPPVNGELVDKIVSRLKSQGIFDQFRKECLADVDTKPAYQNLQQRVNGTVATFLATQTWQQNMNKTQLRETLRRHMQQGFLEMGVDRIVEQVVNPKIVPVFMPKVEDLVYDCLGVEKPKKPMHINPAYISFSVPPPVLKKQQTNNVTPPKSNIVVDLLPKDLDPVSPESEYLSTNNNTPVKDERNNINNNNESTPPKYNKQEDNSQLSGISELSSHLGDNNTSLHENTTNSISLARSITSPKPNSAATDLQFDNFSNLTEKIKQAEISHCHLSSSSQPELSLDRIETENIPIPEDNYVLPTDDIKIESNNDDTSKLDLISNNSMSTFEDSKTFITNKVIKEETCSRTMSEDSINFSFSNDKILNSSIKDESVNSNHAEKDDFLLNKDSKEGFPEDIKPKQESKMIGDIKDTSKNDNKDKKNRESSSSSKTSRAKDHRHKSSDSKHRSSSHQRKEKDSSRDHSKSSKDKYSKDDKDKYSKDEKEKYSKDDKEKYSKDVKEKYSKDDKEKYSKDDKEKYSKDEKEKYSKDDKEKYSKDEKEKYSKDDKEKYYKDEKEKYSKDDKEKYSKDNKEKYSKESKEKYSKDDKDKSTNKDDKHLTSKDKHKEKGKIEDKSKDGDKKERTESSKENAERERKQERDRNSSRHDKDREKSSRSKNERDKEKYDKDKDRKERHEKEKNKQEKEKDKSEKDKDKSKNNEDKSKDTKKHEKSTTHVSSIKKVEKHEEKEKYSKSNNDSNRHKHGGSDKSKSDEKKDRKRKHERCNDDKKTKEARRSSDRDSNGGKGGNNYNLNNENRSDTTAHETNNTNSEEQKKTSNTTDGPSDQLEPQDSIVDGPSSIEIIITKLNSSIEASENDDVQFQKEEQHISPPEIPIKKPKIAKNIFEIRKVMQARKTIDRKYKQELSKINKECCSDLTRNEESPVNNETSTKDIDSKIPEENKENIKSHGLENVKHTKNKSKKFYGFQQADIDKSYNNMSNFEACIKKCESIYKSLIDLKGQNTEELLDNNLNNLKTKMRTFEELNSEGEGKLSENCGNGYVLKNINECPKRGVKREQVSSDVESSETESSRKKLKTQQRPKESSSVVKEKRTSEDKQVFLKNKNSKTNDEEPIDAINLNTNKDSKRGEVQQRTPEHSYEPLAHESVSPYLMTEAMLDNLMKESNIIPDEDVYQADSDDSNSDYECSRKNDSPLRHSPDKTVSKDNAENYSNEPTTTDKQNVNIVTSNVVICREETGKQQDGSAEKLTPQKKRLSRSSQRYESTDLYKPRPVLPQNSKRVRTSRSVLSGSTPTQKKDQSDSITRKKSR